MEESVQLLNRFCECGMLEVFCQVQHSNYVKLFVIALSRLLFLRNGDNSHDENVPLGLTE